MHFVPTVGHEIKHLLNLEDSACHTRREGRPSDTSSAPNQTDFENRVGLARIGSVNLLGQFEDPSPSASAPGSGGSTKKCATHHAGRAGERGGSWPSRSSRGPPPRRVIGRQCRSGWPTPPPGSRHGPATDPWPVCGNRCRPWMGSAALCLCGGGHGFRGWPAAPILAGKRYSTSY